MAENDILIATLNIYIPEKYTHDFAFKDIKSVDLGVLNEYLTKCDWLVIIYDDASLNKTLCLQTLNLWLHWKRKTQEKSPSLIYYISKLPHN